MYEPAGNTGRWLITAAVICGFLVLDFFTPALFVPGTQYAVAVAVGIYIGQVNLIATWAALAPGNVVVRLPWSLLLTVLMWYGIVLGCRTFEGHLKLHGAVLLGGILLGGVLIAQVPLWIAGRVFHWRLVSWAVGADRPGQSHLQFQLKHVLLATALVSVALAPARVVLPPGDINNLSLDRELPVLLVAVTVCNLVITVPCIWGAFVNKALLFRLALGWLAYCAVLSAVELVALVAILGAPGGHEIEMLLTFVILNVSQCATVFGTLLVFRVLGFRLIRTAGAGESAAEGDSPFRERDHGH